jgi:hypothetical protein
MAPMPKEKTQSELSAAWQGLEDEFVPLPVAATVTYFHVTDALRQVSSEEDLAKMAHLVAIALSTVAPLYRDGARVDAARLEEALYRPVRERTAALSLDSLAIRRGDLRAAMTTLKEARLAFGRRS